MGPLQLLVGLPYSAPGGGPAALSVAYAASVTLTGSSSSYFCGNLSPVQVAAPTIGGTGPYTYLWEKISGDDFTLSSTTAQRPTFQIYACSGSPRSAVYRVTVTDNVGAIGTDLVTVTGTWTYSGGGFRGGGGGEQTYQY